jgi:hypothetical protein
MLIHLFGFIARVCGGNIAPVKMCFCMLSAYIPQKRVQTLRCGYCSSWQNFTREINVFTLQQIIITAAAERVLPLVLNC